MRKVASVIIRVLLVRHIFVCVCWGEISRCVLIPHREPTIDQRNSSTKV